MSDITINASGATHVTETATHVTVTHVKTASEVGTKGPSIRSIVQAAFKNGTSRAELTATIQRFHPTSAAAKAPNRHINWYKSEMKDQWEMVGEWAPKATPVTGLKAEIAAEKKAKQIAELEAKLRVLRGEVSTPAPTPLAELPEFSDSREEPNGPAPETEAERLARLVDERLAANDEDGVDETEEDTLREVNAWVEEFEGNEQA